MPSHALRNPPRHADSKPSGTGSERSDVTKPERFTFTFRKVSVVTARPGVSSL
ncbi:hypothetical protein ACWPKO_26580 (plasmid) [Coraliomargarita sp. W4R53]